MDGPPEETSQWNETYCHDQKFMGLNPSRVNLGVRSTSVQAVLKPKITSIFLWKVMNAKQV